VKDEGSPFGSSRLWTGGHDGKVGGNGISYEAIWEG